MTARLEGRRREVEELLAHLPGWAARREDVRAVALVGSHARGGAGPASDVDVVLLTEDPAAYIERSDWVDSLAAGAQLIATRQWGPLTEKRVRLPGGLEAEVGVAPPSWAVVDPVDPGTRSVVEGGLRPVYDPHAVLSKLAQACGVSSR